MMEISLKTQAATWDNSLWNRKEPLVLYLAEICFGLSASAIRLGKLGDDKDKCGLGIDTNIEKCLILLTSYLLQNGL